MPTPRPSTRPTTTAFPIVIPNRSRLNSPDNIASNKTNAMITAKISVNADSKPSMDLASSEMWIFLSRPKTMIELLPPSIEPSKILSIHSQPKP